MSWQNLFRLCLVVAGSLVLWGCGPSVRSGADEEKEPLFLIGRSRVNAMDYQGAIEAFEQALEANPRSGAAHFELGWLYAEKDAAPATAIYHYEKFLKLRPAADNAETIRQHIFRLKQELAKGVLPIPPSTEIQRQLEQLAEENRQLRDQLDRLRAASARDAPTNRMLVQPGTAASSPAANPGNATRPSAGSSNPARPLPAERAAVSKRTHRVQAGETPMAIARRYNVKLDALLTANPGLDPKRMRIGQSLVIPSR
jgi:tetratricopeptide (TPR) repeat protein